MKRVQDTCKPPVPTEGLAREACRLASLRPTAMLTVAATESATLYKEAGAFARHFGSPLALTIGWGF